MSTPKTFLSLSSLLALENSELPRLLQQARHLQDLTEGLVAALPPGVSEHCRVGSVDGRVLVLVTDSPAWSTRLRFYTPVILAHFKERHGLELRDVRVRVRPPEAPRDRSPAPPRRLALSPENAELIQQTAQGIGDPDLRRALLRLAHHGPGKT